jgi:hypothetical protein
LTWRARGSWLLDAGILCEDHPKRLCQNQKPRWMQRMYASVVEAKLRQRVNDALERVVKGVLEVERLLLSNRVYGRLPV